MALKHAQPGEAIDLRPLGESLAGARTSAIVRTSTFEAIRLIVPAGTEIPTHEVPGRIMLHCLEGHVEVGLPTGPVDLGTDNWLYLEGGKPHSVRGVEDSSLLLTILFDADSAGAR